MPPTPREITQTPPVPPTLSLSDFISGKSGWHPLPFPIRFLAKNGYPEDPVDALRKGLTPDAIYSGCDIHIGSFNSNITIPGFPSVAFNSVMFERV